MMIGNVNPDAVRNVNTSVRRGCWGEDVAAAHLKRIGWRIIGRNVRPCRRDRRCELDIVAYVPAERQVVFVEVKTRTDTGAPSRYGRPGAAVDMKKRAHLTDAALDYLRAHPSEKRMRIDVIEVYVCRRGAFVTLSPKGIVHIENALI